MKEQDPSIPSPENPDEKFNQEGLKERRRNLGLSVLLIFSFVYTGMILIVLLGGLFYPELVRDTLQQYYKQIYISSIASYLINLSAAIIMGVAFYGLVLLWRYKKLGFYLFAFSQMAVLMTMVLILQSYDWINIALIVILLVILWLSSKNMD
jgi:hypothetical protein